MNVLIAPNSFKECATATEVAKLLESDLQEELVKRNAKDFKIISRPVSDGGDGFLETLESVFPVEKFEIEISAPWESGKLKTVIAFSKEERKVFVESAKVLGLNLIPEEKRKPVFLSSAGMGDILNFLADGKESGRLDFDEVVIGVGGTGTNDLALGALEKLGVKLIGENVEALKAIPLNFPKFKNLKADLRKLPFKIKMVIDVNNPLLGEQGATRTYGPQKGIKEEEFELFERGFKKIISAASSLGFNAGDLSGAGGGLAAGFQIFYNAEIVSSGEFIKNELGVNKKNIAADVLITGEGKFDSQTLMDKAVGVLLNEFDSAFKIVVCGISELATDEKIKVFELSKYFSSVEESIRKFEKGIKLASEEIAAEISFESKDI